jgi:hypothetical protein
LKVPQRTVPLFVRDKEKAEPQFVCGAISAHPEFFTTRGVGVTLRLYKIHVIF